MADFQFVAYESYAKSSTTKDFSSEHLDEILKEFEYFLKGVGFDFPGTIELVPFETDEPDIGNIAFDDLDFQYDTSLYGDDTIHINLDD